MWWWWWWVYPTHSWGWGRGSTPRSPSNRAIPHGRDQRSRSDGCDRIWPDADDPGQGSQARDAKDPVV